MRVAISDFFGVFRKVDVAFDPMEIDLFSTACIMLTAQDVAHTFQECRGLMVHSHLSEGCMK